MASPEQEYQYEIIIRKAMLEKLDEDRTYCQNKERDNFHND